MQTRKIVPAALLLELLLRAMRNPAQLHPTGNCLSSLTAHGHLEEVRAHIQDVAHEQPPR